MPRVEQAARPSFELRGRPLLAGGTQTLHNELERTKIVRYASHGDVKSTKDTVACEVSLLARVVLGYDFRSASSVATQRNQASRASTYYADSL